MGPWSQTVGGNVVAASEIKSLVPAATSPRLFNLAGVGGYPGAVLYGSSGLSPYDFDPDYLGKGETLVSSANWLVNQAASSFDWYSYFFTKLGGPIATDSFPTLNPFPKPAPRAKPYYLVGDVTTEGNWTVGDGETLMFLVNGNLTINGSITTTGTGFVAFIVKGDVTISSSVGGLYTSSTPVIEGLYVTSPTGTFATGTSSVAGRDVYMNLLNSCRNGRRVTEENKKFSCALSGLPEQLLRIRIPPCFSVPDCVPSVFSTRANLPCPASASHLSASPTSPAKRASAGHS